jgi:hypothetical protein
LELQELEQREIKIKNKKKIKIYRYIIFQYIQCFSWVKFLLTCKMTRQGGEEIVPNLTRDNFIHICASFLKGIQERQLTSIALTGKRHLSTEDENLLHLILYMPHPGLSRGRFRTDGRSNNGRGGVHDLDAL